MNSAGRQAPDALSEYERHDSTLLVYGRGALPADRRQKSSKLAIFDLDETLITTKSNEKFPVSSEDWRFRFSTVPQVLQKHHKRGFLLVIVTNQLGISRGKLDLAEFSRKVGAIRAQIGAPVLLLAAIECDRFRKPAVGTWRYLLDELRGTAPGDVDSASFFCGDSAGRRRTASRSDHSSCDLLYALNCGLRFYLPENMFHDDSAESVPLLDHSHKMVVREQFERRFVLPLCGFERICVLIMGPPKCGKSVIAGFFDGFAAFDCTAESPGGLEALAAAMTQEGFKVVVECAGEESAQRRALLQAVKSARAFVVCFYLKYDYELMKEVYYHANYSPRERCAPVPFFPADYQRPVKDLRNRLFNTTFEINYFPPAFGEPCRVG